MTHTITSDKTVAVSVDHYWLRIDETTPRGVKILLLGIGGVASIGQWDGKNKFWRGWVPLPKKPDWMTE